MSRDLYTPPNAPLDETKAVAPDLAAEKKIKNAFLAGLVSAGITFVFVLIAVFSGVSLAGVGIWSLIDIVIILGLSYGVYRKSRACAVLLLVFFVLNKVVMWMTGGKLSGLPLALLFTWFYGQGVVDTFRFHKLRSQLASDDGRDA